MHSAKSGFARWSVTFTWRQGLCTSRNMKTLAVPCGGNS